MPTTRLSRTARLLALAAVVLGATAGCSAIAPTPTVSPSPTSTSSPTATPTPTASAPAAASGTPFSALAIGDCITDPAGSTQYEDGTVTVVPCTDPHSSEIYALPTLSGASFPGDESVSGQTADACASAFSGYIGASVYSTSLNYGTYTPSERAWNAGVRQATCVAFAAGDNIVGSVRGIGSASPQIAP